MTTRIPAGPTEGKEKFEKFSFVYRVPGKDLIMKEPAHSEAARRKTTWERKTR
jgi:hypothetical protein